MGARKIRVLIAKPGLDGHDVGAKVVAHTLRDAGCEVIYTGLRQSAEDVARAASEEDVDVIGLSILSGTHMPFCQKLGALLRQHELDEKLWIVGGNIPEQDRDRLKQLGVSGVFPTGSPLRSIVSFIQEHLR